MSENTIGYDFFAYHSQEMLTLYAYAYNKTTKQKVDVDVSITVLGTDYTRVGKGYINDTFVVTMTPGQYLALLSIAGEDTASLLFGVLGNQVEVKDTYIMPETAPFQFQRRISGRTCILGTEVAAYGPPIVPLIRPGQDFWDAWQKTHPNFALGRIYGPNWTSVESRCLDSPLSTSGLQYNVRAEEPDGSWARDFNIDFIIRRFALWPYVIRDMPKGMWRFYIVIDNDLNQWGHWRPPLPSFTPLRIPFNVLI